MNFSRQTFTFRETFCILWVDKNYKIVSKLNEFIHFIEKLYLYNKNVKKSNLLNSTVKPTGYRTPNFWMLRLTIFSVVVYNALSSVSIYLILKVFTIFQRPLNHNCLYCLSMLIKTFWPKAINLQFFGKLFLAFILLLRPWREFLLQLGHFSR